MRAILLALLCLAYSQAQAEAPPIQQWIDEAIQAGGGIVTIPEGVHVLSKGLVIKDAKKLAIRGVNKERCVLKLTLPANPSEHAALIEVTGASETVEIANLTLDGAYGANPEPPLTVEKAAHELILINGMGRPPEAPVKGIVIRDCLLQNCAGQSILVHRGQACEVERCSIRDGGLHAIHFANESSRCVARGNRMIRTETAFYLLNSSACLLEGNETHDCHIGVNILNELSDQKTEPHLIRNNGFAKAFLILFPKDGVRPLIENNEGLTDFANP